MLSYIERLRNQPLEERKRAVVFFTTLFVILIILVWLAYLFVVSFIAPEPSADGAPATQETEGTNTIQSPY